VIVCSSRNITEKCTLGTIRLDTNVISIISGLYSFSWCIGANHPPIELMMKRFSDDLANRERFARDLGS